MDFTLYKCVLKLFMGLRNALNWLAPRTCLSCQQPLHDIELPCCERCYLELPFHHHYCIQCGQSFSGSGEHCGHCLVKPPYYDQCFCPFEYAEPISDTIIRLKYHEKPELAAPLAKLLMHEINAHRLPAPDLLIPVPMHTSRLRKRGFNQSTLLTRALSKELGIPMATNLLKKVSKTEPQAKQSLTQRQINLNGSFALQKKCSVKSVAIIDDVVTTGATAGEIAKILKKNGVDYIQVWGLTHTL